ncbi:MAG: hypothetical protein R2830_20065 [Saprospiraceae bacterium]
MKSNKSDLIQIQELLEEISQLDRLISMHEDAKDRIMAKQYVARKRKYFDELVKLLLDYYPVTDMPPAILLEKLFQRFYPDAHENPKPQPALEEVIRPFMAA